MHGVLLPIVLLVAPAVRDPMAAADSGETADTHAADPTGAADPTEDATPREVQPPGIGPEGSSVPPPRADVLGDLRLPSRVAWTLDVGGQPITLVPTRPSGGFKLTVELDF